MPCCHTHATPFYLGRAVPPPVQPLLDQLNDFVPLTSLKRYHHSRLHYLPSTNWFNASPPCLTIPCRHVPEVEFNGGFPRQHKEASLQSLRQVSPEEVQGMLRVNRVILASLTFFLLPSAMVPAHAAGVKPITPFVFSERGRRPRTKCTPRGKHGPWSPSMSTCTDRT